MLERSMRHPRRARTGIRGLALLALAAVAGACRRPEAVLEIHPRATTTAPGSAVAFAVSAGRSSEPVIWSLRPAGTGATGSIDTSGIYRSPAGEGTFTVVATSAADPSRVATAEVKVAAAISTSAGDILPPQHRTTWNPGLNAVGGIPVRTEVFRSLSPGGAGLDDAEQIQKALDECPPERIVKLGPGTFRVGKELYPRSNTTLRGSGPGVTTLLATNRTPVVFVGTPWYRYADQRNLTADAVKGTISVTVVDASGLRPGELVAVDEEYDPELTRYDPDRQTDDYLGWGECRCARIDGSCYTDKGTGCTKCSTVACARSRSRPVGQIMEIRSVDGATVAFTTPFHLTYRAARAARLARFAGGGGRPVGRPVTRVGIEDLTVSDGGGSDEAGPISFAVASYSWAKNVESTRSSAPAILIKSAFRCELRDSYVHSTVNPNPGGGGYGLAIDSYSADNLVENNVVWNFNKVMVMRGSGGGNVIAYNYMQDGWASEYPTVPETGLNASHMTTPHMELFEGNESFNFDADGTWGNSLYVTVFRNHLTGTRVSVPPLELVDQYDRRAITVNAGCSWFSYVGNVLGHPGMKAAPAGLLSRVAARARRVAGKIVARLARRPWRPAAVAQERWVYERVGGDAGAVAAVWWLRADPVTLGRTLRHGNFDHLTGRVVWDPAIPGRDLPESLYLTSKPAFMGSNPWPWVDPLHGTTYLLPARVRFEQLHGPRGR
jgi:hypothetical protein